MSENEDYKINLEYNRDIKEIDEPGNFDELKEKFIEEFDVEESKNYIFNYIDDDEELVINKDNFSEIMEKIKKSESKNIYVSDEKEEDPMRQTQNFSKQFNKSKEKEKEKEKDSELERKNELKNSDLSGQEGVSEFMMGKTLDEKIRMTDNNSNEKKDEYENESGESKENENSNKDNNNFEIIKINSNEEPKELVNSINMNDSKDLDKLNDKIKELNESQIKLKKENDNLLKTLETEKTERKQLEDKVKSLKEKIKKEREEKKQLRSDKKDIETKYDKLNESLSKSKLGESSDNLQILKEKNDELTSDYRNLESENLHLKKEIEKNKNNQDINDSEFNSLKEENTQLKKKIINLENDLTKKNKILYNNKNIHSEKPETIFDEEEKARIMERKNKKIKKLTLINQMLKDSQLKSNKQNKNPNIDKGKYIEEEKKANKKNIEQNKLILKSFNEKRKTIIIKKNEEEEKQKKMEADKKEELMKNKKQLEEKNNELNTELKKQNEEISNLKNKLTKIEESKDTKKKLLLADIDKERDEYKKKIDGLERQLKDKSKELDDKSKELVENKTQLDLMKKNSEQSNLKMKKSYEDKEKDYKKTIDELNQTINKQREELKNYQEKIENYKSDLSQSQQIQLNQNNQKEEEYKIKKKEFHNTLEAKYKELYQVRIKEATNSINESIEKHKIDIQQKYEKQIKTLENNYKKQFNEISQSIMQIKNKSNLKKCQTKHEGIKCNVCFNSPIIGYRYKCTQCDNFNLCEECEEANEQSNAHPHLFIKMAKFIKNLNNIPFNNNDNFIKEKFKKKQNEDDANDFDIIKFGNKDEYSLEIINKHNLNPKIKEGDDKLKIELIIKNNGSKQWPENGARLVFDDNKNLTAKPIYLRPQKPEEQQKYEINMEDLHVYPAGKFEAEMNFEINGKQYGDEIDINVTIEEKEKDADDDDEKIVIQKFRDTYGLDKDDYSDEVLLAKLKKFNFDLPKAFSALFED